MGVDLIGEGYRVRMMVYEYLRAWVREHARAHRPYTVGVIEVQTDEEICCGDEGVAGLRFAFVDLNGIRSGHPVKERREGVGHDDVN